MSGTLCIGQIHYNEPLKIEPLGQQSFRLYVGHFEGQVSVLSLWRTRQGFSGLIRVSSPPRE